MHDNDSIIDIKMNVWIERITRRSLSPLSRNNLYFSVFIQVAVWKKLNGEEKNLPQSYELVARIARSRRPEWSSRISGKRQYLRAFSSDISLLIEKTIGHAASSECKDDRGKYTSIRNCKKSLY